MAPLLGAYQAIRQIQTTAQLPTTNPDTGILNPWMMPPSMASQRTQIAIRR